MPMLDRRSAACTGAMAGIYRRLLEHIAASPQTALASRMSLPGREKAMIAATALAGIGRPGKAPQLVGRAAMTTRRAVVVGGGLAGIAAAIDLRDAGIAVTLLESRPRLGGAATSYARAGMMIDNGQHVFLRCCDSYQGLLARLGATDSVTIQDRFDVTVLSAAGRARLRRDPLPSPLHLARALARYPLLSLAERAKVGRAALAFRFADPASPALDGQRLGGWLAERGQNERARRRLWDLFIVSALNIHGDEASVGLAATVIKTALLGARDAADIGMAKVPLGRLHADATGRAARAAWCSGAARSQGRRYRAPGGRRIQGCAQPRRAGCRRGCWNPASLGADWAVDRSPMPWCSRFRPTRQPGWPRQQASRRRLPGLAWAIRRSSTCTSFMTGG